MRKLIRTMSMVTACWAVTCFCFVSAQTEVMAWGNLTGVRVDGQLMEFESSLRVVGKDWKTIHATGKERQFRPRYHRDGNSQIVHTTVERVRFEQTVTDLANNKVSVTLQALADTTLASEGAFFCLELPDKRYENGKIQVGNTEVLLKEAWQGKKPRRFSGRSVCIEGNGRRLQLDFHTGITAFVRRENDCSVTLYIPWLTGNLRKGKTTGRSFTLEATGEIDHSPVRVVVDAGRPGRLFQGLGGNFRLQNPKADPKVIDYCLSNLRVGWGRVEFPWRLWHPEEALDPLAEAKSGRLNERVKEAARMAKRLAAIGMPVIVSAWFPPAWAIDGGPEKYTRRGGIQAYRLDPQKERQIYRSIADYLVYLKQVCGVEAHSFSFNESDIGIDVLFTPEEHARFIKGLGGYLATRGLATKILLGDNSDATTFDFIVPALNDPETYPYIGAVSFHSWRGCDDATLKKWAEASRRLNVPLIVAEGSTDAAAHTYSEIFNESTFAFYEINLYIRICALCQPLSILQWQLTSDYSVLWGNGIYGSEGPLRPTQRFWNLKQLASTPENAFALPLTCDKEEVNAAAFGNIARGRYAVHLVNNGASCDAVIEGLPADAGPLTVFVTNRREEMTSKGTVTAVNGTVKVNLPADSFVSLLSAKSR